MLLFFEHEVLWAARSIREFAVNADALVIVRLCPAVADRVVAVRHLRFDDEDIAVPVRGAFPLAPQDRMGHLAAIGNVVARDSVRTVLIVLCRGDFQLWVFVFDSVHTALDDPRSLFAGFIFQVPVRLGLSAATAAVRTILAAMQRAVC